MFGRTRTTRWGGLVLFSSYLAINAACGGDPAHDPLETSSTVITKLQPLAASQETTDATGIHAWQILDSRHGPVVRGLDKRGNALFSQSMIKSRDGFFTLTVRALGASRFTANFDSKGNAMTSFGTQTEFMKTAAARLAADTQPLADAATANFDGTEQCMKEVAADTACAAAATKCLLGDPVACVTIPPACFAAGYYSGNCANTDPPGPGIDGAEGRGGNVDGAGGGGPSGGCDIDQCCIETTNICCDDPNGCC